MDEKFSPPNVSLDSFDPPFMEIDPNEDATDEEGMRPFLQQLTAQENLITRWKTGRSGGYELSLIHI